MITRKAFRVRNTSDGKYWKKGQRGFGGGWVTKPESATHWQSIGHVKNALNHGQLRWFKNNESSFGRDLVVEECEMTISDPIADYALLELVVSENKA